MAIEHTRTFVPALVEELRAAYARVDPGSRSVFNDPGFLRIFWDHAERPFVLVFRQHGECLGAAFFQERRLSLAGRMTSCLVPIHYGHGFTHLLVEREARKEFLEELVAALLSMGRVVLLPHLIDKDWRDLPGRTARWFCYEEEVDPVLWDGDGGFQRILAKSSVRRRWNRLQRLGRLEVSHRLEGVDDASLETFFELHGERWAYSGVESEFRRPRMQALFRDVCTRYPDEAAPGNGLVWTEVSLDGEPVGASLSYRWGDTLLYRTPVANLEFWEFSPGDVVLAALVRYAMEEKLRRLDLGYGDHAYKRRFASAVETTKTFVLVPSLPAAFWLRARKGLAARVNRASAGRRVMRRARVLQLYAAPPLGEQGPSASVELGFRDYVRSSRTRPPPYPLDSQLYRHFRNSGALAELATDGLPPAWAWRVDDPTIHVEGSGKLHAEAEDAVWVYGLSPPDRGAELIADLRRRYADRPMLAYAPADDRESRRALQSNGFAPNGRLVVSRRRVNLEIPPDAVIGLSLVR